METDMKSMSNYNSGEDSQTFPLQEGAQRNVFSLMMNVVTGKSYLP